MIVPEPAAASVRRQPALSVCFKVKQQLTGLWIKHLRSDRYSHNHIVAFFSGAIATLAVQSATRNVQGVVTQVQERVD
jgi:hypothetical protein